MSAKVVPSLKSLCLLKPVSATIGDIAYRVLKPEKVTAGNLFPPHDSLVLERLGQSPMGPTNHALLGQDARNLPLSDEEVVRRVRAGETGLFEVVMRRYNQRLYRVARAILRDDAEAEDVTQQAYLNAYRHLDQFASRAMFSTWLTKIAVHEAFARARRRDRFGEKEAVHDGGEGTMDALKSPGPDPERQAFAGELRALIESAIEALPEHYRGVFVMRELEGMSTAASAECLDITEETAKTRLHRARMLLRETLYRCAGIESGAAFPFQAPRCDRVVAAVFERIEAIDQSSRPRPN